MKKTFKIGEYAKGGIISAEITNKELPFVVIKCIDWDTKEVLFGDSSEDISYIRDVLYDWTSVYYADTIIEWIKSNVKEK